MSVVSPQQLQQFQMIGNGSAAKGYALYRESNFQFEYLMALNAVLGLAIIAAPKINELYARLWEKHPSEHKIETRFFTVTAEVDFREMFGGAVWMLNFATLATIKLTEIYVAN